MSESSKGKPPSYSENRAWSDLFIEPIKSILRLNSHNILSVTVSSPAQDVEEGTDYVIRVDSGNVGARVRREHIPFRDLTLGALQQDRQGRTEADKVLRGDPRWYLYCWTKKDRINEWMFLDMEALIRSPSINLAQKRDRFYFDGKKSFISISIQELVEAGALLRYEKIGDK